MYRPQSQISRQRSNDIRDLQSKTKKLSNKQYKDYVKRLIGNNPNHIDSQRRLKIQTGYANRNQLRDKIERKLGDEEKQMWRSGVVRFIKPRISDRDYKRFKKLFDIFSKIQKTKQQIMSLTFSSPKYIKDSSNSNMLYQNQRVKQLKESLLRLQMDEEKILLEIQSQGKENKNQCFSLEKVANVYKRGNNQVLQKKFSDLQRYNNGRDGDNSSVSREMLLTGENTTQNNNNRSIKDCQSPNGVNKRIQSQTGNNNNINISPVVTKNNNSEQQHYIVELYDFLCNMDGKKTNNNKTSSSTSTRQLKDNNNYTLEMRTICEQIKQLMITKQKTIDQLFVNLSAINSINHGNQDQTVEQNNNHNQFNKFHQIDRRMKQSMSQQQQQQQQQQHNHAINGSQQKQHFSKQPICNKRYTSFKSLLKQLQQDLIEYKHMGVIKQRNNQLAKKLNLLNKQLQYSNQQRVVLQKQINDNNNKRADQCRFDQMKMENQHLTNVNQKLLKQNHQANKQLQQCNEKIQQLQNKVNKVEQMLKQESDNYQKYYRQALTLQQEVRILSEQNQKLVHQLSQIKLINEDKIKNNSNNSSNNNTNSNSNSHQKSIKPCSSTSLIYKQFQRKNKKLTQQNINLKEINKQLQQKITQLQQQQRQRLNKQQRQRQRQRDIDNYKVDNQQLQRLRQQNMFMQQQNKILLQENKKIQQQFQYLVKQKLQIQSHLSQIQKQNILLNQKYKKIKLTTRDKLIDMHQVVIELKEDKQILLKQMNEMKFMVREMFNCLNEEIANALEVFVSGLCGQQHNRLQLQSQQQQHSIITDDRNQQQISQQQQKQQLTANINTNIQNTMIIQQQYQALLNEFNHCLYELTRYQQIFNQAQIEKQLQKKYHQQDIYMLKMQINKMQKQIGVLNGQLLKERKQQVRGCENENNDRKGQLLIKQTTEGQTQTDQLGQQKQQQEQQYEMFLLKFIDERRQKLKINCEPLSIKIQAQIKQQSIKIQAQIIKSQQLQLIHSQQQSTQTQPNKYDHVNSLTLHSKVLQFTQTQKPSQKAITRIIEIKEQVRLNKHIVQNVQKQITLQQWLSQLNIEQSSQQQQQQQQHQQQYESNNSYEQFVNFCMVNLQNDNQINLGLIRRDNKNGMKQNNHNNNSTHNYNNTTTSTNQYKQTDSHYVAKQQQQQLSSNHKNMTKNQSNTQQQSNNNNQKIGIFGSLYNKFSFPKLQPTQTKYEINKNKKTQQTMEHMQLPLQMNSYSIKEKEKLQSKNNSIQKTQNINQNSNNNQQENMCYMEGGYYDEDESFDLCII